MSITRVIAYGVMVLALSGFSVAAYAADAENDLTGPNSTNKAWVDIENKLKYRVDNDADVSFNFDDIDVTTGYNKVEKNTTAGDNESGDADVTIDLSVDVEQDSSAGLEALGAMFGNGGDHSVSNKTTGPNSTNKAWVNEENNADVKMNNNASIKVKDVDVDIDTGNNTSKKNTTVGDTSSGNASFSFTANFSITQK